MKVFLASYLMYALEKSYNCVHFVDVNGVDIVVVGVDVADKAEICG